MSLLEGAQRIVAVAEQIGHRLLEASSVTAEEAVHKACFIAKHRTSK